VAAFSSANVMPQRAGHVFLVLAVAMRQRDCLQAMCQAIDRKAAKIAIQQARMIQPAARYRGCAISRVAYEMTGFEIVTPFDPVDHRFGGFRLLRKVCRSRLDIRDDPRLQVIKQLVESAENAGPSGAAVRRAAGSVWDIFFGGVASLLGYLGTVRRKGRQQTN
jgi:hypothetical protein